MPVQALSAAPLLGTTSTGTARPKPRVSRARIAAEVGLNLATLMFGLESSGRSAVQDDPSLTLDDFTPAELAVLSIKDKITLTERTIVAAKEKASHFGLRPAPPPPPRKIGVGPDGKRFDLPDLPPPEPPPPIHKPTVCRDLSSLRSVAECDVFIRRVELGLRVADTSLGYLPAQDEGEPVEVARRRERLLHETRLLSDHLFHLQERRSELFMAHVDDVARRNAQAEAAARTHAWLHGRAPRPH